jgi:hypothetical protein
MEGTITTTNIIDPAYGAKAMDYDTYKNRVNALLEQNQVTGLVQSEALVAYTRLNVFRMHRIEKTIEILPEVKQVLESLYNPQTWLVLTEGWCGDASQILPVLHAMAQLSANIRLLVLLRDENPELMDKYLTNGESRSIPKLIVYHDNDGLERFNWGPRPLEVQEKFERMKSEGMGYDAIKEEVHRWYAKDRTYSIQREITALLSIV